MRGNDDRQDGLFIYVSLESWVRKSHPLRPVLAMVDQALRSMPRGFGRLYAEGGAAVDRAGTSASRVAVAGVLLDSK